MYAVCKQKNIKNIIVNSDPYALESYQNLGFDNADCEQTENGIRFIPMVCLLK